MHRKSALYTMFSAVHTLIINRNNKVIYRIKPACADFVISCAALKAMALEEIQMGIEFNSTLFQRFTIGPKV